MPCRRHWLIAFAIPTVTIGVGCTARPQASLVGLSLDTTKVLAEMSQKDSDTFRFASVAYYDFPELPDRIAVLHATGVHSEHTFAFTLNRLGEAHAFYDSQFTSECGEDQPGPTIVTLLEVAKRPLVVLEEARVGVLCVGQSTREIATATFFDPRGSFRKVLALERSNVNHGNYEDSTTTRPTFRHTYFVPNACTGAAGCLYLSVFTASSELGYHQHFYSYHWNSDSTALVGFR